MGDFEIIETGFSSADETINFGTRCIGLGSLYEISTVACFKSYEDGEGVPQVTLNCLLKNEQIILATNKSLKIFDDTKLSNLLYTAVFDANIVSLTVSPNNRFMLICLQSGVINVFHLRGGGEIDCIFTRCLSNSEMMETSYVKGFCDDHPSSFLIVYNTGEIFRIIVKLSEIVEDKEAFEVSREEISNLKSQVTLASYNYPTLLTTGCEFSILNVETGLVLSDTPVALKKCFPLEHKYLGLDFEGDLHWICSLTMIIHPVYYDTLLEDILVVNDGGKRQIFAVTKPNESGETFLQLLNIDLTQVFSLKISNPVYLIENNSTTDDLLFLSKVISNNTITELRLQNVYETEPELKLTRLIRRLRFEEAEKFAKTYNINPMVILKAKAQHIVEKSECSSSDISNLMKLMDQIDDEHFKLQCCSNVECSRFEDVRKILTYGSTIHVKNDSTSQDMKRVLTDLLYRFNTFVTVSKNEDMQSWCSFSTCDLIEELKLYLKNYDIESAIFIYSRMDQKTIDELTEDHVNEILLMLHNLPMDVYQPFLSTFIPITMHHLPSSLPIFVKWLYGKIFLLEKRDKLNFPLGGIILAEKVLKLLRVEEDESFLFQKQCTLNRKSIEDLGVLIEALKTLQLLKEEFGINVELADYFKGPENFIHILLTSHMTPDDYDNFLEQFLHNYMLQNNFNPDVIFLDEIKTLLKYDDCWVSIIEAILKHIGSVKIKLEATKEILENADVPWCKTVRKIAHNALQYSHPIVGDIKTILSDEQRLIVMRNPKYKIKERQINNHWELEYIIRKIIYFNEPSLVEDVYHLCKSVEDRQRANEILVEHFILTRHLDDAIDVLVKNTKEDIYVCTKSLVSAAEITINEKLFSQERKDNYYKALPMLFSRLLNSCSNSIEREQFEEHFCVMRGVYEINKYFGRTLTTHDLMSHSEKGKVLEDLLEEIAENIRSGIANIDNILSDVDKLSLWFSIDKNKILIKLCDKVGTFELVLKVAEHMYDGDSDPQSLCLMAGLFLKYLGSQSVTSLPGDSFSVTCNDTLLSTTIMPDTIDECHNGDIFLRGLKLAQDVIAKAFLNADGDDLLLLRELEPWVDSCFYLTRQESVLQAELFKTVFSPKQTTSSFAVFNTLRSWFHTYVGYIDKLKGPNRLGMSSFNSNIPQVTQAQLQLEITSLPITIDLFCREGHHLTAFKLLNTLQTAFSLVEPKDSNVVEQIHTIMMAKCLPQLLDVVVSAENIDVDFAYSLLLASGKNYLKYVHDYLRKYKRQPKKFHDLAVIGIRLVDVHGETKGRDVMLNSAITCKWWKKLKSVRSRLAYDEFFKASPDARARMLIGLDVLDVGGIREYCQDYRLNVQHFFMEYLMGCLTNWKPEYEIATSLDGKKSLVMLNNEDSLLSKCQEIINVIEDKNAVVAMLETVLKVANFYHYEVFICIYRILENNAHSSLSRSTDINLLLFLKSYSRFSTPSQREREEWYSLFPDNQTLDALSEFRLPFTQLLFTTDIWSILRPEMSLKSYRFWFDGTNILRKNLKIDDICVYAVKHVVSSKVMEDNVSQEWVLHPKFEDLLQEVDECVSHISDFERATSVVYHLMNNTPNGADKVNAAGLCYKYASMYLESNPNSADVENAFKKVKNKYYGFSAKHILHTFNLAEDHYLNLVTQPEALVEKLYMEPRIIEQVKSVNLGYPDINKAVDALAELFGLKITKIRRSLLNEWLSNSSVMDLDTTIVFPSNTFTPGKIDSDDNLRRAAYMCSGGDVEMWRTYLMKVGLSEDKNDEPKSISFKCKALKCFCAITDEENIAELTNITYQEFLDFVHKLTLLSELECLGISLDMETLDVYNKKELLKRLSQIGKPLAIKSMGFICMMYFLDENRYWEYIIKNSIKQGMIAELKVYVKFLKDKCDKNYYVKAWQVIIENAFQQASPATEDDLDELYLKNFLMIQSCPALFSIDFEKTVQLCINFKKYEYAAVLSQYLADAKKMVYLEEIVKSETLLRDLDVLESKGIYGIGNVKRWLREKTISS